MTLSRLPAANRTSKVNKTPSLAQIATELAAVIARRRALPVITAVCLLYLAVWSFNPNGAYSYFLWGIPFLLVAGYLREVAVLQLVLAVPAAIVYGRWNEAFLKPPYLVFLIGIWLATVAWFIRFARTA